MNEWTGELNNIEYKAVIKSLQSTINSVLADIRFFNKSDN